MQVEKLPIPEINKVEETSFSSMSPVGFKLHAFIEHKVITSIEDVDNFKKRNAIHEDYIDDLVIEMIDKKIIKVEDGKIQLLKPFIFEGFSGSDEFQSQCIQSYSELARQMTKKALTDRQNQVADTTLDFATIIHFADDPEVLKKAKAVISRCYNELSNLAVSSSSRSKNQRVRGICFAGSLLSEEGF